MRRKRKRKKRTVSRAVSDGSRQETLLGQSWHIRYLHPMIQWQLECFEYSSSTVPFACGSRISYMRIALMMMMMIQCGMEEITVRVE